MDSEAPYRHCFWSVDHINSRRHFINFGTQGYWDIFAEEMRVERARIMFKYNYYLNQIAICETAAAVEAITIDFSA
jgi:hypothetical protein